MVWNSAFRDLFLWMFQLSCFLWDPYSNRWYKQGCFWNCWDPWQFWERWYRGVGYSDGLKRGRWKDAKHTCTHFITFLKVYQHFTHFFWKEKGLRFRTSHLSAMWPLANLLNFLSLSFTVSKIGQYNLHFIKALWGWREIIYMKLLPWCLEYSRCSVCEIWWWWWWW